MTTDNDNDKKKQAIDARDEQTLMELKQTAEDVVRNICADPERRKEFLDEVSKTKTEQTIKRSKREPIECPWCGNIMMLTKEDRFGKIIRCDECLKMVEDNRGGMKG